MQTNMLQSIQDYARKINSRISIVDCISVLSTILVMLIFLSYITDIKNSSYGPLIYREREDKGLANLAEDTRLFGSKKGKTYTYAWCGGSSVIRQSNKIYFKNESQATKLGRTLSKLCTPKK